MEHFICHFTKYVVKNIFVVLLSLLDSKLCNSMDPKSNFLLSVVQTIKNLLRTGRGSSHEKQLDEGVE